MTRPQHPTISANTKLIISPPPPPLSLPSQNIMLDPRTDLENSHFHTFNTCRRTDEDLGTMSFGSKTRNTAQNYENYRIWNVGGSGVQFSANHMMEYEDEFGGGGVSSSPPLWQPQNNNYRHLLSQNSRAQAIARGRSELMEMVKSMPESCYELSLKDLVEHPTRLVKETDEEACLVDEKISGGNIQQEAKVVKRRGSQKKNHETNKAAMMMRISSIENGGLLLKMVLPFSLGSKKKKKSATNTGSRVSPRPEASDKSSIRSSSSSSGSSSRSNSCRY